MTKTKDFILFEAFRLFLEKGYDKVSMNELVRVSGLSKGAFYHYFPSKEELFREAITTHFIAGIGEGIPPAKQGDSLLESLIGIIDSKAQAYKKMLEMNKNSNFFNLLFQAVSMFPEFRTDLKRGSLLEEDKLALLFEKALAGGEIKTPITSRKLAQMYAAMLDGMELHAVVTGELDTLHSEERKATEDFVKLLNGKA
ncbi:TetR/AcrR family transcriptional regulator [Perlabentimonas gracilis]|uniref:TetR/AcrR family transcriptional regulator n=1 Tax=Perlabentimonas gracilis TaxID=2715279 RepID=UPI00140BAE39|nr:TetR/AcrR family transcriptional regulator [Perlabentimonas gracilis]NHB67560.1 TetR/AcrR family transcriptional regulator [Perlabentimonas gracilis]